MVLLLLTVVLVALALPVAVRATLELLAYARPADDPRAVRSDGMAEGGQGHEPSEFIESASAVGGALAGTAMTLVAGPFVGSASGELTARVLLRVGAEIAKRLLAPRQERRIAEA